jgi:hypothetical protein
MVSRQVSITQRHRNILMPQQFFDCRKVHTRHDQPTRKRMSEIIECKVLNACLTYRSFKGGPKGAIRLTMPITKYASPFSGV